MNNWQTGQGGPLQQSYNQAQPNDNQMVRLPDGTLGTIADLVKFYSNGQGEGFHPADLQDMQRQGVNRG